MARSLKRCICLDRYHVLSGCSHWKLQIIIQNWRNYLCMYITSTHHQVVTRGNISRVFTLRPFYWSQIGGMILNTNAEQNYFYRVYLLFNRNRVTRPRKCASCAIASTIVGCCRQFVCGDPIFFRLVFGRSMWLDTLIDVRQGVNRHTRRRSASNGSPWFSANNSHKTRRIAAKLAVLLRWSISHILRNVNSMSSQVIQLCSSIWIMTSYVRSRSAEIGRFVSPVFVGFMASAKYPSPVTKNGSASGIRPDIWSTG